MPHIPLAVIGAGQAGLAVSRVLGEAGVEHVILERGRVAERWRMRRNWRSLRLLTPNWMTRLPGWSYSGPDPDGYMTAGEVAGFLGRYADSMSAPVVEHARGAFPAPHRRPLPRPHRGRHLDHRRCRARDRLERPAARPRSRRKPRPGPASAHPGPLPRPHRSAGRRRAHRGCVRHRGSARRRTRPSRASGRRRRRATFPSPEAIPRRRHHALARHTRRQPPRSRPCARPGRGAAGTIAAAGRPPRPPRRAPGRAAGARRPGRRPAHGRRRRPGLLRRGPPRHHDRRRRPVTPPARPHRRPRRWTPRRYPGAGAAQWSRLERFPT